MSSEKIVLTADKREVVGKKVSRLRQEGYIPANVYERGEESITVAIKYNPLIKAFKAAGKHHPIELTVDDKKFLTLIKDVHMDPAKNTIMHVAFHAVKQNETVEAEIPVHIEGDVPALQSGNFMVRPNDVVTVKAFPGNLPDVLNVPAATLLEVGDTLTVADIVAPKDVEIISDPHLVLAVIEEPRAVVEPEPTEEVDAADVPSEHGDTEAPADSEASKEEKSE